MAFRGQNRFFEISPIFNVETCSTLLYTVSEGPPSVRIHFVNAFPENFSLHVRGYY